MTQSRLGPLLRSLALIGGGCVLNNWALEVIISTRTHAWADAGAGGMLTLMQFVFISLFSLDAVLEFDWSALSKRRAWPVQWRRAIVPMKHYVGQTILFFAMSYLNNIAFKFGISQPTHMVFRSANLVVTFVLGYFLFGERYTWQQLAIIVMITVGAASSTLAEAASGAAKAAAPAPCDGCEGAGARALASALPTPSASVERDPMMWGIGIAILCAVLLLQSMLSHYQNWTNRKFGRAPREAMFYSHTMSLPIFLFTLGDLRTRYDLWSASPSTASVSASVLPQASFITQGVLTVVSTLAGGMPIMWFLVLVNAASQLMCVSGVYGLVSLTSALTVNVALTVRKSISLVLSVYLFSNPFTTMHTVGAILVFGGAFLYSVLPSQSKAPAAPPSVTAEAGSTASKMPTPLPRKEADDTPPSSSAVSKRPAAHQRTGTTSLDAAEGGGFRHRHTPTSSVDNVLRSPTR